MPWKAVRYQANRIAPSDPYPNGRVAWRPMLIATLHSPNGASYQCLTIVDSGADQCVFPISFALILGLDILKMKKNLTSGVGSSTNVTYYDHIEIDLLPINVRFAVYAGFTASLDQLGIGLLGQDGFFEKFNTSFYHKLRRFQVEVP